jgi:hypothetical protein
VAMQLSKKWGLAVLRVRLQVSGRHPAVTSEMIGYSHGDEHHHWSQSDAPSDFGIEDSAHAPTSLCLPPHLRDKISQTLADQLDGRAAFWLHLVPPYGYLGAVPWETLVEKIDVPMLRVPDRLPMSTDIGRKWTVAIAICAPRRRRWGAQHVLDLCSALHDMLLDPPQIDVFADAETVARLRSDPKCSSYTTVKLHDPSGAQAAHHYRTEKSAPRLGNQPSRPGLVWADWIAEGLAGKAVRAVHIVAEATFDGDRPLLRVAADPNELTGRLDLIRQDDLSVLADRVGATLLSLGSPPHNSSDVATRTMIDAIGQTRPGPTLYSDLSEDLGARVLAQAHAFLADATGGTSFPRQSCVFGYLQPELIERAIPGPIPRAATEMHPYADSKDRVAETSATSSAAAHDSVTQVAQWFTNADEVPTWVAASTKFLDSKAAELSKVRSAPGEAVTSRSAYDRGATAALSDIGDLISRFGGPT